jgi:hypothetical protein
MAVAVLGVPLLTVVAAPVVPLLMVVAAPANFGKGEIP